MGNGYETHTIAFEPGEVDNLREWADETFTHQEVTEEYQFTPEKVITFGENTRDDQEIHTAEDPLFYALWDKYTDGLLDTVDVPETYQDEWEESDRLFGYTMAELEDDPDKLEDVYNRLDEFDWRGITHGEYGTVVSIAQRDEPPESFSVFCAQPVYRTDSISAEVDADTYDIMRNGDTDTYEATTVNVDATNDEIDITDMMLAHALGMGAFDRRGDILLGFPKIEIHQPDLTGVEEMYLKRSRDGREPDRGPGMVYENELRDQDDTLLLTYEEQNLHIDTDVFDTYHQLRETAEAADLIDAEETREYTSPTAAFLSAQRELFEMYSEMNRAMIDSMTPWNTPYRTRAD